MDGFIFKQAVKDDCIKILELIKAESDVRKRGSIDLKSFESAFNDNAFICIIVEDGLELVGCSVLAFGYASWQGKRMFIEDFCLKKRFHNSKLEDVFFSIIFKEAVKRDCSEMRAISDKDSYLGKVICKNGGIDSSVVIGWHIFSIKNLN